MATIIPQSRAGIDPDEAKMLKYINEEL